MPATDLVLSDSPYIGTQKTYVKSRWADAWEEVPGLHASLLSWLALPNFGQATLHWAYGLVALPGEAEVSYKAPLDLARKLILIEFTPADPTLETIEWYGVALTEEGFPAQRVAVNGERKPTGSQTWHCFELAYLLDQRQVLRGYVEGDGEPVEIAEAPDFNSEGQPNRSSAVLGESHLFAKTYGDTFSEYWATVDMINYLLRFFPPQLGNDAGPAFTIENYDFLLQPEWDRPVVDPHGESLLSLLGRLLNFQRGLGGYLEVVRGTPPEVDSVRLRTFTFAESEVVLGDDGETLPENPRQFNLIDDKRPDLATALKESHTDRYHRVILEGGPRRAVCTLDPGSSASEYVADWTDDEETAYNDAASAQSGYSGLGDDEKRMRNADVRSSPHLQHVFAEFKVRDDWDGRTSSGTGTAPEDLKPVFVDDDNPDEVFGNWPAGWRLLQALPLFVGVDYSGSKIADGEIPEITPIQTPFMPPAMYFPTKTDPDKWFDAAAGALGQLADGTENRTWSVRLRMHDERAAFRADVVGDFQHVIADQEFVALAVDDSDPRYEWQDSLTTVCFEERRRARVVWPEDAPEAGFLLEKYVDLGRNAYRVDYVVPNTVVGIDPATGELLRSDGGFARDDRPKMLVIAKQLHQFYQKPRRVLRLTKQGGPTKQLWIGDLVKQLGAAADDEELVQEVGTVVTQVTVAFPGGEAGASLTPTQTWDTAHGELDALIVSG